MSAITKPMIHSSRATGSQQPINAEKIIDFMELETPSINNQPTKFQIVFTMESGSSPKNVAWNYADQTDMNADFAAIVGLVSTVTP